MITQRLLKASLAGDPPPYSLDDLAHLALHCTTQEDAANRVERQVRKSAVALVVESRIGERFAATVTGASERGTWVRVATSPTLSKTAAWYSARPTLPVVSRRGFTSLISPPELPRAHERDRLALRRADRVLVHIDTDRAGEQLVNRRLAHLAVSRSRHDARTYAKLPKD